jgi:hypothetical protein
MSVLLKSDLDSERERIFGFQKSFRVDAPFFANPVKPLYKSCTPVVVDLSYFYKKVLLVSTIGTTGSSRQMYPV